MIFMGYVSQLQRVIKQYRRGLRSLQDAIHGSADIMRDAAVNDNVDMFMYRELAQYIHDNL